MNSNVISTSIFFFLKDSFFPGKRRTPEMQCMEPMDSMLLTAKGFLFLLCCFKFHVNIVNTLHLFTLLLLI